MADKTVGFGLILLMTDAEDFDLILQIMADQTGIYTSFNQPLNDSGCTHELCDYT